MSRKLLALAGALVVALVVGLGLLTSLSARTTPDAPEVASPRPAPTPSAAPAPAPAPTPVPVAGGPAATQPAAEPAPPAWDTPPRTPTSWVLPMELGWDDVDVGEPIHSPVAFRLPRCDDDHAERFQARIADANGRRYAFEFPVAGLLPRAVAQERSEVVLGDEVIVARAPVLLALPEVTLPAHVELVTPDGRQVATLRLTDVAGEVRALRVR